MAQPAIAGPPQPAKGAVLSTSMHRIVLVWKVDLDLTAPDLNVEEKLEEGAVPLPGLWAFSARREERGIAFGFLYTGLGPGELGEQVRASVELRWAPGVGGVLLSKNVNDDPMPKMNPASGVLYSGNVVLLKREVWEEVEAKSGGQYNPKNHRAYRFAVTLESGGNVEPAQMRSTRLAKRVAGPSLSLSNLLSSSF
jgi:hypothetical protein